MKNTEEELDELWGSISRMEVNPGALAAQEHLAAGLPVYGYTEGLKTGEVLKTYPDGREEVVRIEFGTRKEIFVRPWE